MNAVGIDVSKGKSTVAVLRPFGEVVAEPFDVVHEDNDLNALVKRIKALPGETKAVMEYTGNYYEPIARALHNASIYVSVVNAILVHNYGGNSIRKVKTDKKDALKLASYTLDKWLDLKEYTPEEDTRKMLKVLNRQYIQYTKMLTMQKNNLISLLDMAFPGINSFFSSPPKETTGHEKWVDFVLKFYHARCVADLTLSAFKSKYQSWCKKNHYYYQEQKAEELHAFARKQVTSLPADECTQLIITQSASQLISILETVAAVKKEMNRLASQLPEYKTVMEIYGAGPVTGVQLMAEIGDTRRFHNRKAIVAFAGLDPSPYQSGNLDIKSRSVSKRGSPQLRKTLFQIINAINENKPADNAVYQFLKKKRSEGKLYKVCMIAAAAKFLRIYYARVNEVLNSIS